jgi:sec-independent protein translocase protein TatB
MSLTHLLIIGVLALVFIGPKELPEVARVVGRLLNELKRASGELTASLFEERRPPPAPPKPTVVETPKDEDAKA